MRSRGRLLLALLCGFAAVPAHAGAAAAIAIVIDDLGDRPAETRLATELPGPVACAFLPESPYTRAFANAAHAAGKEVLLHLPLQPIAGKAHPLTLVTSAADPARDAALDRLLASVPHLDGVNNHEGSLATSSHSAMHWLMGELVAHRVGYFIDSYTSASSVAYPIARAHGLPTTRRRVFLDNDPGTAAINAQFDELLRQARIHGYALAIGHPHLTTLAVLRERLPQLAAQGVVLLPPSQLIARYEPKSYLMPVRLQLSEQLGSARTLSASAAAQGAPQAN
ncbi:divergent polysaccharide deacetylase family protein [Solimonas terrae]|uniref:Divergent polysaccharide deacetylase family protein n=1 Tax=Solimonas terrae TaxID=1396819 RepID=A0A6M2BSR9_9GAMM|nr:divergent polysaccharide deacetylase family protein [Solimonas terrae]NGY05528.1 divergent polysaccharide deacetylase family protein [Solimonas terrae]